MKTSFIANGVFIAVVLSGCASVSSFEEQGQSSSTNSNTQKEIAAASQAPSLVPETNTTAAAPTAGSGMMMPEEIKPQVGETYIRKITSQAEKVSLTAKDVVLFDALMVLAPHGNFESKDSAVDLSLTADVSVNGMDRDRFLSVVERSYDVEIVDHGDRLSIAGVINGVINVPNSAATFEASSLRYLETYAPHKPAFVAELAGGRFIVSGSPNAVKSLLTAEAEADVRGQQAVVDLLVRSPYGQLTQTQFLVRTEGTSSVPIAGGMVTVSLSMDADHQLTSDIEVNLSEAGLQTYQVVSQSGNRLPLTYSGVGGAYEIAYTAKLISQFHNR